MATIQIPNHSHCVICTRAVAFGDKTCSKECEKSLDDANKQRKKQMRTLWILMAIAFGVAALPLILNR